MLRNDLNRPFRVWRWLKDRDQIVTCDQGSKHVLHIYVSKDITWKGDRELHDNGYTMDYEDVAFDRQGRKYVSRKPIDYTGQTYWLDDNHRIWAPAMRDSMGRDIFMRRIP